MTKIAMLALLAVLVSVQGQRGGGGRGGGGGGGRGGCSSDSDCTKARKPVCVDGECVADDSPVEGCCIGTTSKCDTDDKTVCDRASTCDWESDVSVCEAESVDEGGCCYGTDSRCDTDDEATCTSRQAQRKGCEWRAGEDADCTVVDVGAGCCYSVDVDLTAQTHCSWQDTEADCLHRTMRQFGCVWLDGQPGQDADCDNPPPSEDIGCCHGNAIECFTDDENMCTTRGDQYGCEWRTDPDSCGGCCIGGWNMRDSDWDIYRDYQDDCDIAGTDNIACVTYINHNRCGWKGADEYDENGLNYCATVAEENENGDGCCAQVTVGDPNSVCHQTGKHNCLESTKCEWVSREEGRARFESIGVDAPACQDDAPGDPAAALYKEVTLESADQLDKALPAALMMVAAVLMLVVYRVCAADSKKLRVGVANETQPLMA